MKKVNIKKKDDGLETEVHYKGKKAKKIAFLLCVFISVASLYAIISPIHGLYGTTRTTIVLDSVSDIRINETMWINITARTITDPRGIGAYAFTLTYDPSVVHVVSVRGGDAPFDGLPTNNIQNALGWTRINAFTTVGTTVNNTTLCRVELRSRKNDGSISQINLTVDDLVTPGDILIPHTTINGTFRTLDEVPPRITFDVTERAPIAGPDISVNARLFDLSGINASSIVVMLNNTPVSPVNYTVTAAEDAMTWNVRIRPDITNYGFRLDPINATNIRINVSARDNSTRQNFNHSAVNVTVAKTGFFELRPTGYINTTSTMISARFVHIDNRTVKMYLTHPNRTTVNVTPNRIIGADSIIYQATNLTNGLHTVLVNGTIIGESREKNATWNFTVDTIKPAILHFGVSDSDGDGFIESVEHLIISWNISDPNFGHVVIRDSTRSITNDSRNSSINNWTSAYGNQKVTFRAVDKAGNFNETTFHVYNNYIAYVTSNISLSFGEIDLNKTAVMDLMNLSVSKVEFFGGRNIDAPSISSINRTFIPGGMLPFGTSIIVDNRATATITDTYRSLPVYNPGTNLSFRITAPSVNRANVLLVQANSSRIDEFLEGKPLNLATLRNLLTDIKNNRTEYVGDVYLFGPQGYARIFDIQPDGRTFRHSTRGRINVSNDIIATLEENEVNLSHGFSAPYLAQHPISLPSGTYKLIAFSLDEDRIGLIATMPLIVANSTATGTVTPSVRRGETLSVSFPAANLTAAIMIRNVPYNINAKLNISVDNLYIGRLDIMSIPAATQQRVSLSHIRGGRTINLSASFPEGHAAVGVAHGRSVSINTSNLVPGEYILYAVAERDIKVEAIGRHIVHVLVPPVPPVVPPVDPVRDPGVTPPAVVRPPVDPVRPPVDPVRPPVDPVVPPVDPVVPPVDPVVPPVDPVVPPVDPVVPPVDPVVPPVINVPVDPATGVAISITTLTVEKVTLTIPEGTIIRDAEGRPLATSITTLHIPEIAERIDAIDAYDFGPDGTTFSPPIDLVIAYDPADLPAGYRELDLVIRMWDGNAWIDLDTTVDTVANTATVKVSHFTIFALFAAPPVEQPVPPVVLIGAVLAIIIAIIVAIVLLKKKGKI